MSFKVGDVVEVQHPTWDNWQVMFCLVVAAHGNGNYTFVEVHAWDRERAHWDWHERTSEERVRRAIASFVGIIPCPSR